MSQQDSLHTDNNVCVTVTSSNEFLPCFRPHSHSTSVNYFIKIILYLYSLTATFGASFMAAAAFALSINGPVVNYCNSASSRDAWCPRHCQRRCLCHVYSERSLQISQTIN